VYKMEWEIITKEIKDTKGQIVVVETPEQIDEVGNIYQKQGGVIPKACQKCKKEFKSEVKEFPIKQKVPYYKCKDCDFENAGGDVALDHKIQNIDHNIKKITKDRIVGVDRKIIGIVSYVTKTKDDVLILCGDCNGE